MILRDPVSSASHLFVALWAFYALLLLIRLTPASSGRRLASGIFGASMVFLYLASGIFHGVPFTKANNPEEFRFFQRIDQSAIFFLIAGTNTPLMVTFLHGAWQRWCLRGMWGFAVLGVASLWFLPKLPHEIIVVICLAMGWIGLIPTGHYYRAVGWKPLSWIVAGALLYTLGAVCEMAEWPLITSQPYLIGFHEVFHLLSAAASGAFFVFVAKYVILYTPPAQCATTVSAQPHSVLARPKMCTVLPWRRRPHYFGKSKVTSPTESSGAQRSASPPR